MSPDPVSCHLDIRKTARYYRLGEPGGETRDIWVVCHGYAQLAARFVRSFEPIASATLVVAAPEAPHRFYLDPPDRPAAERRVGATWMTREDRETDIADYVSYLDTLCVALRSAAPAARITGLGFSQGAATVSRWAVASDMEIARLILWGSGLPPDLDWARAGRRFRSTRLSLVIGDRDEFATPTRVAEQQKVLEEHGIAYEMIHYPGGHRIDASALFGIAAG